MGDAADGGAVSEVACIDLVHDGLPGAIGAYLVDGPEPCLVDPGPTPSLERLVDELAARGVGPRDLRHVLLTHVHLDHAGATGHLVERFPEAVVWVHADGAAHMAEPGKLVASTRRTFGEAHDRLWGEVRPVPSGRIRAWSPGDADPVPWIRPVSTPGHIAHHLAYLDGRDGTLLAGDSMGIVLSDDAPTHPPTPPPAVDLAAWAETLDRIDAVGPERFGAAHFGLHGDVPGRIEQLRTRLDALERRVGAALAAGDDDAAERFEEEVREELAAHLDRARVDRYFDTFSAATDWHGVRFHLERRDDR